MPYSLTMCDWSIKVTAILEDSTGCLVLKPSTALIILGDLCLKEFYERNFMMHSQSIAAAVIRQDFINFFTQWKTMKK